MSIILLNSHIPTNFYVVDNIFSGVVSFAVESYTDNCRVVSGQTRLVRDNRKLSVRTCLRYATEPPLLLHSNHCFVRVVVRRQRLVGTQAYPKHYLCVPHRRRVRMNIHVCWCSQTPNLHRQTAASTALPTTTATSGPRVPRVCLFLLVASRVQPISLARINPDHVCIACTCTLSMWCPISFEVRILMRVILDKTGVIDNIAQFCE